MAVFEVRRASRRPVEECWRRVTDWDRHSALVPLTRVGLTAGERTQLGSTVLARTGVGPLGFDDPMEVVRWEPPPPGGTGRCRLEKRGSVVRGWAEIEVSAGGGGSLLLWREEVRLRGFPRAVDPVVAAVGQRMFARVIDRLLRAP